MDELFKQILQGFPTFAGLIVLAYILYTILNRLLTVIIDSFVALRVEIQAMSKSLDDLTDEIRKQRG